MKKAKSAHTSSVTLIRDINISQRTLVFNAFRLEFFFYNHPHTSPRDEEATSAYITSHARLPTDIQEEEYK